MELTERHVGEARTRGGILASRHRDSGLTVPVYILEEYVSVEDIAFAVTGEKVNVGISLDDAHELYDSFENGYYDAFDDFEE